MFLDLGKNMILFVLKLSYSLMNKYIKHFNIINPGKTFLNGIFFYFSIDNSLISILTHKDEMKEQPYNSCFNSNTKI